MGHAPRTGFDAPSPGRKHRAGTASRYQNRARRAATDLTVRLFAHPLTTCAVIARTRAVPPLRESGRVRLARLAWRHNNALSGPEHLMAGSTRTHCRTGRPYLGPPSDPITDERFMALGDRVWRARPWVGRT